MDYVVHSTIPSSKCVDVHGMFFIKTLILGAEQLFVVEKIWCQVKLEKKHLEFINIYLVELRNLINNKNSIKFL